ncbi:RHS repeat-associated core domain-containing protein [Actinosynnema pretiosum]|nr:RHS repeat-associated core domain-containing protein [Actinosynnema pretiosum]
MLPIPATTSGRTIATEAASPKGAHDNPFANRPTHGGPIDVTTGWVVLPQVDVDLASTLPLLLTRTHVSHYRLGRSFGPTWACTADQRLEVDPEGVALAAEDGTLLLYPHPADDAEALPEAGPRWPLVRTTAGGYAVHRADRDQILHFAPGPDRERLLAAITDADGRCVQFRRDERGVLVEVAHSGGYRVLVDSEDGLITAYRLAGAGTEVVLGEFRYDERRGLVAAVNSSGLPLRFEYDDLGRVVRYEDRNGMWHRYAYDDADRCTAAEGAGGYSSCVLQHAPGLTKVTDSLGNTTTYQVNERYQVVCETDPTGARTVSEWDAHHRLLSRTRPLGLRTAYRYDDRGDLVEAVLPDGARVRTEHDDTGRPVVITDPDGAVWRREYGPNGALTAVVDPMGARTTCTYDEGGDLVEVTDASGATTHYEVNSLGLVESVTDPMGGTTRYEYDELGRRAVVIDPAGGRTRFTWTPEGRLAGRVDPDGARTVLRRDGEGNLREHTDATGAVTSIEVGPFDLPVAEVRPDGSRLEFRYDTELRPVAVVNEHGQEWRYAYDSRGHLVSEVDFDQRITTYVWDQAGRLHGHANERGESVMLDLDPRDRVVAVHTAQGRTDLAYDPVGRLLRAKGPDADLVLTYDPCGRVLSESVDGRVLESRYDVLGRRVTRRTPSGALSVWAYDLLGRPTALRAAGRTTRFSFDAVGREVERRVDDGVLVAQVWDEVDRLRSQTVVTGLRSTAPALAQRRTYGYRPDGKLVSVYDQVTGGQVLDLDEVGRVLAVRGSSGTEVYQYDRTGNVVHAHWSDAEPGAGPREHDLMRVTRAGDLTFRYDEAGRTSSRSVQRPDGGVDTWEFEWSAQDRLLSARTPSGALWRYGYDALGRRVWKKRMADDGVTSVERVDLTWDGAAPAEQFTGAESLVWDHAPTTGHVVTQTERSRVAGGALGAPATRSAPVQGAAAQQPLTGAVQGQPDYAARLGQGGRSGEDDQVARLGAGEWNNHSGQGDHAGQVSYSGQGGYGDQSGYGDQAGRVEQAGRVGQAGPVEQAGRGGQAGPAEQVGRGEQVGHSDQVGRGGQVGRSDQVGGTADRAEQSSELGQVAQSGRGEPLGHVGRVGQDGRTEQVSRADLIGAAGQPGHGESIGRAEQHGGRSEQAVDRAELGEAGGEWADRRFLSVVTDLVGAPADLVDPDIGSILPRRPATLWGLSSGHSWTPLRFPGQQHDAETGLHYDVHRYYDPATGRYLTRDPLGLAPRSNPWTYAENPTAAVDLVGLVPCSPLSGRAVSGYLSGWAPPVGRFGAASPERLLPSATTPFPQRGYGVGEVGRAYPAHAELGPWHSGPGRAWTGVPGVGEPSVVAGPMSGTCGSRLQELADRHQRDLYVDGTAGSHRSGGER